LSNNENSESYDDQKNIKDAENTSINKDGNNENKNFDE
jgi:hypothetical protein